MGLCSKTGILILFLTFLCGCATTVCENSVEKIHFEKDPSTGVVVPYKTRVCR